MCHKTQHNTLNGIYARSYLLGCRWSGFILTWAVKSCALMYKLFWNCKVLASPHPQNDCSSGGDQMVPPVSALQKQRVLGHWCCGWCGFQTNSNRIRKVGDTNMVLKTGNCRVPSLRQISTWVSEQNCCRWGLVVLNFLCTVVACSLSAQNGRWKIQCPCLRLSFYFVVCFELF